MYQKEEIWLASRFISSPRRESPLLGGFRVAHSRCHLLSAIGNGDPDGWVGNGVMITVYASTL